MMTFLKRHDSPLLHVVAALFLLVVSLPAIAIAGKAVFGVGSESFVSLAGLFYSLGQTVLYVGGVVLLALALALPAAWLTVVFSFRGRGLIVWMLFLPFALPPYITAYVLADICRLLHLPTSGLLMACVATALALYPYIYFLTRTALRRQHCHIQSAARLLGCSPLATFWRVSFPMARPAIGVGVALVVMESLNDIAVAEFFGVQTLGVSIYDLWLNRNDAVGATRLALFMMGVIGLLVWAEEASRRRQSQYVDACDKCYECERAVVLSGGKAAALWAALLFPPLLGFLLPIIRLLYLSVQTPAALWLEPLQNGFVGSIVLAGLLVITLLIGGIFFTLDKRYNKRAVITPLLGQLTRVIYALPGTILAQGAFVLAATVAFFGGGQWLPIGSLALLILACSSRFFIIVGGALESGMNAIPPHLDSAAKLVAIKPLRAFLTIHLPLIKPSVILATVMIFLEGVKELPMTLLLRPFNFDTLATIVYQYASDEALEQAAPSALVLITLSAIAVSFLFVFEGRDSRGNN